MKISKIEIANVLGLHRADIEITTPVLMVLGDNEAGKSSLRDAVSMAVIGDPVRVKLKKDYGQLLHDDAKKGRVTLMDGDDLLGEYLLPKGDHQRADIAGNLFLPHVINPSLTATMDEKLLRTMLFQLTRCKVSPDITAQMLIKRGAREDLVEEVKPMLRSGFPAAAKDCAERATQAKGAFRVLTGENWGSVQSEGWEQVIPEAPDMPDVSPEAIDAVIANYKKVATDIENGVAYIAKLEAKAEEAATFGAKHKELTEAFGLLTRAKIKLETDQTTLSEQEAALAPAVQKLNDSKAGAVPVACPCCAELLRITGQTLEKFEGLKADTKVTSDLALQVTNAKNSIEMLKRTIENDVKAVLVAENAGEDLAKLGNVAPAVASDAMQKAQDKLTECRLLADKLRAKCNAMKERQELIENAEEITKEARGHHQDVIDWSLIADELKPDGIPADILASALKPVNDSLAILSRLSGWKKVAISKDMEITADGRIYGLMSESAKWRIDTLLALAISQISELRFVILDRFDVLDGKGKKQLFGLLLALVDMNLLDQAIICGTMKEPIKGMPPSVSQVWIANGNAEVVKP